MEAISLFQAEQESRDCHGSKGDDGAPGNSSISEEERLKNIQEHLVDSVGARGKEDVIDPLGSLPATNVCFQSVNPRPNLEYGLNQVDLGQVNGGKDRKELMDPVGAGPSTCSEVHESQGRAELGSTLLAQLQLEEECIRLQDPVVILDLPSSVFSPEYSYIGYGGVSLSQAEIEKCRRACAQKEKK